MMPSTPLAWGTTMGKQLQRLLGLHDLKEDLDAVIGAGDQPEKAACSLRRCSSISWACHAVFGFKREPVASQALVQKIEALMETIKEACFADNVIRQSRDQVQGLAIAMTSCAKATKRAVDHNARETGGH